MLGRHLESRNFRSVRYRTTRDNSARTADPSTMNFRIKRSNLQQSTITQTNHSQKYWCNTTMQFKNLLKTNYLESFNSMMERTNPKKTNKQVSFFDEPRAILPNFQQAEKQVQQSQFPLLQTITEPFDLVTSLTKHSKDQIQRQRNQMAEIKADLRLVKEKTIRALKDMKKTTDEHLEEIRSRLRKNQIQQNERKLRTKRELWALTQTHNKNTGKFEKLDESCSRMQKEIFNSTPYNLENTKEGRLNNIDKCMM